MKHLAAYCLLVLSGNATPSEDDVANLLKQCGVSADKESLKHMIAQVGGASVHEHIAKGQKKMSSAGVGGGAPAAAAAGGAAPAEAAKEEPKKEEEEEEEVDTGGFFGGDDDY